MAVNLNDKVVLFRVRGKKDHIVAVPSKSASINDKAILLAIGDKRNAAACVPSIVNLNDKVILANIRGSKSDLIAISDNTEGILIDNCYYGKVIDSGFMDDEGISTYVLLNFYKYPLTDNAEGCRVIRSKAYNQGQTTFYYPTNPINYESFEAYVYQGEGESIIYKLENLPPNCEYHASIWSMLNSRYSIDKNRFIIRTPIYAEPVHNSFCMFYGRMFALGNDAVSNWENWEAILYVFYEGKYNWKGIPESEEYSPLPSRPVITSSNDINDIFYGLCDSNGDLVLSGNVAEEDISVKLDFPRQSNSPFWPPQYPYRYVGTTDQFQEYTSSSDALGLPYGVDVTIAAWNVYLNDSDELCISRNPSLCYFRQELTGVGYISNALNGLVTPSWTHQASKFSYYENDESNFSQTTYRDWNNNDLSVKFTRCFGGTATDEAEGLNFDISYNLYCVAPNYLTVEGSSKILPLRNVTMLFSITQLIRDSTYTVSMGVSIFNSLVYTLAMGVTSIRIDLWLPSDGYTGTLDFSVDLDVHINNAKEGISYTNDWGFIDYEPWTYWYSGYFPDKIYAHIRNVAGSTTYAFKYFNGSYWESCSDPR